MFTADDLLWDERNFQVASRNSKNPKAYEEYRESIEKRMDGTEKSVDELPEVQQDWLRA